MFISFGKTIPMVVRELHNARHTKVQGKAKSQKEAHRPQSETAYNYTLGENVSAPASAPTILRFRGDPYEFQ
jgi:hypothetical protein